MALVSFLEFKFKDMNRLTAFSAEGVVPEPGIHLSARQGTIIHIPIDCINLNGSTIFPIVLFPC